MVKTGCWIDENIHRHRELEPDAPLGTLIPRAVDEVGGPTILATFTVIAALLPMAFVSGLMGPYMRPIPIHASMGTISAQFSARLAAVHRQRGQHFVAAPVFGRPEAAAQGKLWVIAAGDAEALRTCRPLFESFDAEELVAQRLFGWSRAAVPQSRFEGPHHWRRSSGAIATPV
jgi:hypothetical protein